PAAECWSLICRSFHDEVEHTVLVQFFGGPLVPHCAIGDHQYVVRQPQDFFDLTGDHHDGGSLIHEPANQVIDLRPGADVHTARWFVQQEHVAPVYEPASQHGLLLVPSGQ